MSGLVNVRYCNAPEKLRYKVVLTTGGLEFLNLTERSVGVFEGLQLSSDAHSSISSELRMEVIQLSSCIICFQEQVSYLRILSKYK